MNFSLKLFVGTLLIFSHTIFAMSPEEVIFFSEWPLSNQSPDDCITESSDGVWRVYTCKICGELLCKKNSEGEFDIQCVMPRFTTKQLIPIKSKFNKDRFVLRMTDDSIVDVIDMHESQHRFLSKSDAHFLNQIPVDLKSAYMSYDNTFIGVQDSWYNTTRVANPLIEE